MKSNLADIKQLFNVKDLAFATTIENLAEGQLGIFPANGDTSIATAGTALPENFRLIGKFDGKLMFSFDTIKTSNMRNIVLSEYQPQAVNVWEGTIGQKCDCTKVIRLNINIDEDSLYMRDGMTWTHSDNFVELTPEELDCLCGDDNTAAYSNNVITQLMVNKVNSAKSPFYEAAAKVDVTDITVYATVGARDTAEPSPAKGDLAVVTSNSSLYQYNGTAWEIIGDSAGNIEDVDSFVENSKDRNTDADAANQGPNLIMIIKSKVQDRGRYADLDVNYVRLAGARIQPVITLNDRTTVQFTETQQVGFEVNSGYDLRASEWENMNNYTTLNYYPQLSDGIQSKELVYQFENGVNYDVVGFEFTTPKVETNDGESRLFGVFLGAVAGSDTSTELKTLFGV